MITIILLSLFGASGWGLFGLAFRKYKLTNKALNKSLQNYHPTPIKELVAHFKEFVQGVDGQVSPEIDNALKQLEAHYENAEIVVKEVKKEETKETTINGRKIPNDEIWKLFAADMKLESGSLYEYPKMYKIVMRWARNYYFNLYWQKSTLEYFQYNEYYRNKLRKYFEKQHGLK